MTQNVSPRTIADELRVIRKAIRRIQGHENHEALKAIEEIKRICDEAKVRAISEEPQPFVKFQVDQPEGWTGFG